MEGGLCERCQDRRRRFKNFYSVECEPTSGGTRPRRHPPGTQCWAAQKTGRASCRRAWHKSAMKELARRLPHGRRKDPHTATDCISQRPSQLAACNALILHRRLSDRANRNGPGIALTLGRALRVLCVLPRAPGRILFRIPDGLTESVPIGILLLQTADVSIHLRATGPCPVKPQALSFWGH